MLEKDIEERVVRWAKDNKFIVGKVRFAENGWPDRLFLSPFGHTIFIEFKKPGERPDPLQWYRIQQLQARGIPAKWTDNYVEAISILKEALVPVSVPEESNPATAESSGSRVVPGPGIGKNFDGTGYIENTESQRDDPEGPDYSATPTDDDNVAR